MHRHRIDKIQSPLKLRVIARNTACKILPALDSQIRYLVPW